MSDEVIGEFDLNAILLRIEQAKDMNKANTLIIDSLQAILLGLVNYNPEIELLNLFSWARHEQLTVLCTVAADVRLFQTVLYEEYIVDCAIELSQQLKNNLMTRYLRVVKLRGSAHGTNQYPFSITSNNISLIPITETRLVDFNTNKYISTGIKDLDRMLGNKGYQIGSTLMLSGRSGTGKTIFAASLAKEALLNKKKVLLVTFEESPSDMIQHLQSAGIDLSPYIKNKKLMIDARRSTEMGLEDHIISLIDLANSGNFDFIVLDPISSLLDLGNTMDLKMLFIRFISNMRDRNTTLVFTELLPDYNKDYSNLGLSSLTDTWIRLRITETSGEFNRMLFVAKSRGTDTSNQLKEFLITSEGILIEEPYVGEGEMLFGSKKTEMMLNETERLHQNQEKIKHLDRELKALHEELEAQQLLRKAEFIIKENALLDKKQEIMNQGKQIRTLEKSSKQRRD